MTNKEIFKKIIGYFIKNISKKSLVYIVVLATIVGAMGYLEPLVFFNILQKIEEIVKGGTVENNALILSFAIWGGFIILSIIVEFIFRYFFVVKPILKNDYKNTEIFSDKIINMNYDKYLKTKAGSIFKQFDRGIEKITYFLFFLFADGFRVVIANLFVFIALFIIDFRLALALLSTMPIFIYIGYNFTKKTGKKQEKLNKKWEEAYGHMSDALSGFGLLKTLNLEKKFKERIMNDINEVYNNQLDISKRWAFLNIHTGSLVMISRFVILVTGIFLIQAGEIGFATLILFFNYVSYIYFSLNGIMMNMRNIQDQLKAAGKLFTEFENLPQDKKNDVTKEIIKTKGKIELKDVRFSYTEGKEILKGINITINPGEKIALVGETGSGKSTISNLLLRFWDVKDGEILYNGTNLNSLSKTSIREHIGIVMQDNSLFNTTIRENLLFAKEDATEEELMHALKKAKAEFVLNLSEGLDTKIGERGLKLSGGEKQRISIARIFLRNPEVLILDEATSALDNKTEKDIQESLNELMENKTTIVIAHRLSTIKKVDKIIVLNKGEIIEEGKYDELIEKGGKFFELANPDKLMIS